MTSPSQALRSARPHPFAVSSAGLTSLVGGGPATATLMLPSVRRSPLDSPELVRITPRSPGRSVPSLLGWAVPVVALDPSSIEGALARFVDGTSGEGADARASDAGPSVADASDADATGALAADVRPAASVRYLVDLARFAGELVGRSRVLPTLEGDGEGATARWRAVLTGPDAVAAHSLIAAMPPAFRAADPSAPPGSLATMALNTITDALVRRRLPHSFLRRRAGRRPARTPAVEAWLDALAGPDPRVDADARDLALLRHQLHPLDEVGREDPGPAHLVLRLSAPATSPVDADAPADESDPATPATPAAPMQWRLDFLLRSRADPSLMIDADHVWGDDGALSRWLDRPREVLLTELARASRVYPALEAGLRQAHPSGLPLDTETAFGFLTDGAATLDEAGFEVLLPAWWSRRPRVGLRLTTSAPNDKDAAGTAFGRDQLCDFRWELAVGDHGLSEEEIIALAEAKASLVQVRGEWIAIDQSQLARGLRFLQQEGAGRMAVGEVLALAVSHPDDVDLPLPLLDVTAGGRLGALLGGTVSESMAEVEPPDDFTATLRPYQHRGLGWLDFLGRLGLGACLADDMGLGKTVQLLALESTARARRTDAAASRPTLLLCPMSLIGNWEAEARRFAPGLRVLAYHGPERPRGAELTASLAAFDLVVTTYATALGDIDDLAAIEWERVVLDEAQAIKNRLSRTAKAVRRLRSGQRIALTGTPVENRLAELWSIMDFLNPGILGSPELFRTRYATPIERHRDDEVAGTLRRVTRPYILRRLKTDPTIIDDLPEKIEIKQYYRLTVEQASLYQSVVDEMMDRIESSIGIERRGNVLAAMTKLKQICNHPAQLLHDRSPIGRRSGKVIRLEEILEEILAEGDRVLCFTQFTEFAELLLPHLASRFDTDVAYLSGSTPRERRSELVSRFQGGDGPPIFLLSLKAGGTGLNLTAANHVVHLDRWWNPAVENQATDRAFRIGQRRRVQVRKFIGTGTLEERIDQLIEDKQSLANLAVGDGESWLTELSTTQLRELFALSKEAIGE